MFFRIGSIAFLFNGNNILLIKRAKDKKIAPGVWSGIAGHLEPFELNDPLATCYREVYEESGISQKDIKDLRLRYIVLRRCNRNNEVRLSYIYFGKTDIINVKETIEGELFWVDQKEVLDLKMTFTFNEVLNHQFRKGYSTSDIFVGVTTDSGIINWTVLGDYENPLIKSINKKIL